MRQKCWIHCLKCGWLQRGNDNQDHQNKGTRPQKAWSKYPHYASQQIQPKWTKFRNKTTAVVHGGKMQPHDTRPSTYSIPSTSKYPQEHEAWLISSDPTNISRPYTSASMPCRWMQLPLVVLGGLFAYYSRIHWWPHPSKPGSRQQWNKPPSYLTISKSHWGFPQCLMQVNKGRGFLKIKHYSTIKLFVIWLCVVSGYLKLIATLKSQWKKWST